jgi:secondary thiamine-phosphate synthase enzyme
MGSFLIQVRTNGQALYEITEEVLGYIHQASIDSGICVVFIQHTSASLIIQENADPSAKHDLERWLSRLVPPENKFFSHTAEGPDDMPAHVKATLTGSSLSIPIIDGTLALGTWQGIYLWEHRVSPHLRRVVVSVVEG